MKGRRKKQDDSQRVCTLGCTEGLSQSLFFSLSFFSFNYTTIKSLHTGTSEKRFILTEVTWSALSDKVKYPLIDTTYMLPICSFRLIFNRMTEYLTVSVHNSSHCFLRSFIQMKCQWCFVCLFVFKVWLYSSSQIPHLGRQNLTVSTIDQLPLANYSNCLSITLSYLNLLSTIVSYVDDLSITFS